MTAVSILLIVGLGIVLAVLAIYNSLVKSRLKVREAWSTVEVQLQRRYSLIPNLVETVKGYAAHERETLDSVTAARAAMQKAGTVAEKGKPPEPPRPGRTQPLRSTRQRRSGSDA